MSAEFNPVQLAYQEGVAAFASAATFDTNPYGTVDADLSGLAAEWARGWLEAREAALAPVVEVEPDEVVPEGDGAEPQPRLDGVVEDGGLVVEPIPAEGQVALATVEGGGVVEEVPSEAIVTLDAVEEGGVVEQVPGGDVDAVEPVDDEPTEGAEASEDGDDDFDYEEDDYVEERPPRVYPWVVVMLSAGHGLPPFVAGQLIPENDHGDVLLRLPAVENLQGHAYPEATLVLNHERVEMVWTVDEPTASALRFSFENPSTTPWGVNRQALAALVSNLKPAAAATP